jgi:hypothetical protein
MLDWAARRWVRTTIFLGQRIKVNMQEFAVFLYAESLRQSCAGTTGIVDENRRFTLIDLIARAFLG